MLHLYVQETIAGDEFILTDREQLHHLTVVKRARHGDAISLFDREGNAYNGLISQIKKDELRVRIESCRAAVAAKLDVTVACAIPKASGMEEVVDNLTQLGVSTIIPMVTERVVAKPHEPEKKLERWRKIALSAAEQSQRNTLPSIPAVWDLKEVLQQTANYELKLIPTLEGRTETLTAVLRDFARGRIAVLIGPEGDFTAEEVNQALKAGFNPVSLGANVLKVSVAAAAVAAFIGLRLDS